MPEQPTPQSTANNDSALPCLPFTATAVAEALYETLDKAAYDRGRASLAIPGGRSPAPVLSELAGMLEPRLRGQLHLLWLDERAVPLNHTDRNDAPMLAAWEAGGALPGFIHPMPAELSDLAQAAQQYSTTVQEATAGGPLDAALIGIGEDGHFASLFPEHAGLEELDPVFACYNSPKPPSNRLSLSLPVIRAATSKEVLVFGAQKGERLAQSYSNGTERTNPVSYLLNTGARAWCDDAAWQTARGLAP